MAIILGIDLGTQSVKAVVIDTERGIIATAGKDYKVLVPQVDYAEEDAEDWWRASKEVLRQLKQDARKEYDAIESIGITGQMHGLVALDKGGRPNMPSIIWVDQRSKRQVEEIYEKVGAEAIAAHIHNRIFTGFALPSLLWVKEKRPEIYRKIDRICNAKDYIRMKLTGELACEVTDASSTTMFDLPARNWYFEMLDQLDIDGGILPPCHESVDIAGCVTQSAAEETGLRKGIPVIYGAGDQSGLIMGNGVYREGLLVANIGTGGTMATYSGNDVYDRKLRTHTFCNATEKSYTVFGAVLGGGISLRWLRDNILEAPNYEKMTVCAAEIGAGSEGVLFLPYLGGERTPHMNPDASGLFFGLKLKHDLRHMIRAVMEGVVYALKDSLMVLEETGIQTERIIASGGGARSGLWLQMQADIFGKEVVSTRAQEQAALGIGIIAGIGTGIFQDAKEGCDCLVAYDNRHYYPDKKNAGIYDEGYETFRELYRANETIMNHSAKMR